jgi:hypothetical protein
MPRVCLRQPLKRLAGDRGEHMLEGATVGELLAELERAHPAAGGWILDERGVVRRHINVFGKRRAVPSGHARGARRPGRRPARDLRRSPAVTELVVGTKKGLFVLEGEPGSAFDVVARAFAGEPVEYALRDPRSGRLLASVTSPFYGPKLWYADDPAGEWEQAAGVALPEGGDAALERIWTLAAGEADGTIYAGGDPGAYLIPLVADMDRVTPDGRVRVYETRDAGASWTPRGDGLPPRHAYLTVLREAFDWAGEGGSLQLYFGATSGAVFGSGDAGASWFDVATHLPPVMSVAAT